MTELAKARYAALGATEDSTSRYPYYRFDAQAQRYFARWLKGLEQKLRSNDAEIVRQHLAKYRGLMPSLTLIFHLLDTTPKQFDDAKKMHPVYVPPVRPIPLAAAKQAVAWCDYLESHARRVYSLSIDPGYTAARHLADKLEAGELQDGFAAQGVGGSNGSRLRPECATRTARIGMD